MSTAEPFWRLSMVTCWKTNKYFNRMHKHERDFLARDDWKDLVKSNYSANQAYIDQQWDFSKTSWN